MQVTRGYRTELALNNKQITACKKHAGAARYAWNWGLRRKQEVYQQTGRSISSMELHRELNALKQTELPWMYEVSKAAPQEALRDLDTAMNNFFRRVQDKKAARFKGKAGYPRFKSKKRGIGSFRLTGAIHVYEKAIDLPRLGRLRLKESGYIPTDAVQFCQLVCRKRQADGMSAYRFVRRCLIHPKLPENPSGWTWASAPWQPVRMEP
jgi:putative transposase